MHRRRFDLLLFARSVKRTSASTGSRTGHSPEILFELFWRAERVPAQRTFDRLLTGGHLMFEPDFHAFHMDVIPTSVSDRTRREAIVWKELPVGNSPAVGQRQVFRQKLFLTYRTDIGFIDGSLSDFIGHISAVTMLKHDRVYEQAFDDSRRTLNAWLRKNRFRSSSSKDSPRRSSLISRSTRPRCQTTTTPMENISQSKSPYLGSSSARGIV